MLPLNRASLEAPRALASIGALTAFLLIAGAGCGSQGGGTTTGAGGAGGQVGSGGAGGAVAKGGSTGSGGSATGAGGTTAKGGAGGSVGSGGAAGAAAGTGGSVSTGGASGAAGAGVACASNCGGKTCGDDGCGHTCGGCPPSQLCGPAQTCVASSSTTSIVVDPSSQLTPISAAIYGVALNNDDSMKVAALNRWGGDATSSYNWKNDVSNAGDDWNCANYVGRFDSPTPDSSLKTSSDQFVRYNITQHADTSPAGSPAWPRPTRGRRTARAAPSCPAAVRRWGRPRSRWSTRARACSTRRS
jgi:hypothetical protein